MTLTEGDLRQIIHNTLLEATEEGLFTREPHTMSPEEYKEYLNKVLISHGKEPIDENILEYHNPYGITMSDDERFESWWEDLSGTYDKYIMEDLDEFICKKINNLPPKNGDKYYWYDMSSDFSNYCFENDEYFHLWADFDSSGWLEEIHDEERNKNDIKELIQKCTCIDDTFKSIAISAVDDCFNYLNNTSADDWK